MAGPSAGRRAVVLVATAALIPQIERAAAALREVTPPPPIPTRHTASEFPAYGAAHAELAEGVKQQCGPNAQPCEIAVHQMWVALTPDSIAHWLAHRTLTSGAAQSATELDSFLQATTFQYTMWTAIGGVFVDRDVPFEEGLWLRRDRKMAPDFLNELATAQLNILHLPLAVIEERRTQQIERRPLGQDNRLRPATMASDDIILCLSLVRVPAVPFIVGLTCDPDHATPVNGYFHFPRSIESSGRMTRLYAGQTEKAQDVFHALRRLPQNSQQRFRTPMSRLNAAMRRRHVADTAIDLGIALESLYLGSSDGGDKKYQASVRCAFLLGRTTEERHQLYDLGGCVYHLRNRGVHRGELAPSDLPGPFKGQDLRKVLEKGGQLVADSIIHFVASGIEPDWSQVVLGPLPPSP